MSEAMLVSLECLHVTKVIPKCAAETSVPRAEIDECTTIERARVADKVFLNDPKKVRLQELIECVLPENAGFHEGRIGLHSGIGIFLKLFLHRRPLRSVLHDAGDNRRSFDDIRRKRNG